MFEQKTYIAKDGSEWSSEWYCEKYDYLLDHPEFFDKWHFYDFEGNPIDFLALHTVPRNSFFKLDETPKKFIPSIVLYRYLTKEKTISNPTEFNLPNISGLWYYSPSFLREMDWIKVDSPQKIKVDIEALEKKLILVEKILQ